MNERFPFYDPLSIRKAIVINDGCECARKDGEKQPCSLHLVASHKLEEQGWSGVQPGSPCSKLLPSRSGRNLEQVQNLETFQQNPLRVDFWRKLNIGKLKHIQENAIGCDEHSLQILSN